VRSLYLDGFACERSVCRRLRRMSSVESEFGRKSERGAWCMDDCGDNVKVGEGREMGLGEFYKRVAGVWLTMQVEELMGMI